MTTKSFLFAMSLFLALSHYTACFADTWYVSAGASGPRDGRSPETGFQRIQQGIDVASNGDTVTVAEGTYVENIQFKGKNITLTSKDPLDPEIMSKTIIDGNQAGSVVTFSGTEEETCVLSGFTIRNGKADYGGGVRGGTEGERSRGTIVHNTITESFAASGGGGLAYCDGAVRDNHIVGNCADAYDVYGAGLYMCSGTVEHNLISENYGALWGGGLAYCDGIIRQNTISANLGPADGGGLYGCAGTIEYNTIEGHSVTLTGGGLDGCSGTIRGNRICGNWAGSRGGGLYSCGGTVTGNIIAWNSAGKEGGGLYRCDGAIENNSVFENIATDGGGLYDCDGRIVNCIIWGNTGRPQVSMSATPVHCCIEDWTGGEGTNSFFFPHFADAEGGDFHLQSWSPCIDAGDPSSPFSNEPGPNGGRINIGAFGNTSQATPKSPDTDADTLEDDWEVHWFGDLEHGPDADPDTDGIPNINEYRYGSDPTSATQNRVTNVTRENSYPTIQAALCDSADGDEIVVYPAVYFENIYFGGRNVILRSANESVGIADDAAIIDGRQKGSVVTFSGTEDETCLLAGFVIRNGKAESGVAGICGSTRELWTRATILNNIVAFNSGVGIGRCVGTIQNNTIYGNTGSGVVRTGDSPVPVLRNCIIWGNLSAVQVSPEDGPTYCCIEDWIGGGEGNISSYLHFVDPANGDFRLRSWSPCIDAGDPASDFSREPDPNGGRINMGAYGNTALAASRSPNTDNDGLPDDWEIEYFAGLAEDDEGDADNDGFSNLEEYRRGYNPSAPPATWYVDASALVSGDGKSWATAFKRIQQGIVAASDGDTVVVAPGIYVENVQFRGKNIVLTSTDPLDPAIVANTVIDGNRASSVVTFSGTEDETSALSGFTIRNGGLRSGAGISGSYSRHPLTTIQHNAIVGNSTRDAFGHISGTIGGGIAECDGLVQYNTISGNISFYGGGIAGCNGTIQHNTISGNSAGEGGGISGCNGIIQNNVISYNRGGGVKSCEAVIRSNTICRNSGGGLRGCSGPIVNCMIYGNWNADLGGGLLYCWGPILNCTIARNRAYISGGGLYSCAGTITNCIIWGNSAPDGAQFDLELTTPPTYSCIEGLSELTNGNINSDPLFVNPAKYDYHLLAGSPCINSGTNDVLDSLQTDMDGEQRPFGLRADMGADEYVDSDGDDLADRWEMIYLGTLAFGPSDDPDADGLTNGQEIHLSTDPNDEDTDDEGLKDGDEVYVYGTDPTSDDTDGDGLKDDDEVMGYGTDPNSPDSDADGMPDGWEKEHGLYPMLRDGDADPDGDGLTNLDEYFNETNPLRGDTEGDGMPDGWELEHGLDPRMSDAEDDPDDDGLPNFSEYQHTTDPNDDDTDNDALPDGWEVEYGLDPLVPGRNDDPDGDGLSNLSEYLNLTDPLDADTDDDTVNDGDEVFAGTDPLDPGSLLRILAAEGIGTGLRVEWSVVPGRRYQVYKSTDLTAWNAYLTPMTPSPGETSLSILDPKALGQRRLFFRVEVLP